MAGKPADAGSTAKVGPAQFFELGKEQTEAMAALQKELLEAYEQASRAWLDRVKSEGGLLVGAGYETDGDKVCSGNGAGLSGVHGAADANGSGRRTTIAR
jgi:hypothetical protein